MGRSLAAAHFRANASPNTIDQGTRNQEQPVIVGAGLIFNVAHHRRQASAIAAADASPAARYSLATAQKTGVTVVAQFEIEVARL